MLSLSNQPSNTGVSAVSRIIAYCSLSIPAKEAKALSRFAIIQQISATLD